jgi:lipoate-protein ligase A
MSIDRALLEGVGRGASPPTVRVFGWAPPTVSTGHSQDVGRELDLEACAKAGVGTVRRPTGGRAVLHAGELTYAVAGVSGEPPLGASIMDTYFAIAGALLAGLRELGVEGELGRAGAGADVGRGGVSPPCFASAGRFEVVVGGRKLIGSAQRRSGKAVLQHGSLLIDGSHIQLVDLLRIERAERRRSIRLSLEQKTTDLSSILGRSVQFGEVASAVARGFEIAWGAELVPGSLSHEETEAAERFATEYTVCC